MADLTITQLQPVPTRKRSLIVPCVDPTDTTMASTGTDYRDTWAGILSQIVASDLPIWDAINGAVLLVPVADPGTPTQGDVWVSTSTGGLAVARTPGLVVRPGGPIFSCSAGTAVSNTTAATSLFAGAGVHFGSLTLPANSLKAGNVIALMATTKLTTASTGPMLTLALQLGGTTIVTGSDTMAGGFTGAGIALNAYLKIISVGASGTAQGALYVQHFTSAAVNGFAVVGYTPTLGTPVVINTTGALAFDFQAQFGTASASNTYQLLDATLSLF